MAKVIGIEKSKSQSETVYDPTCGSGSLLLKAANESPHGLSIQGQENDNATRALAVMNMWLHGNVDSIILQGNTLADPLFKDDTTGLLKTFDYAVANPPFSNKNWSNGLDAENDIYKRFEGFGTPPKKNGDYAFLLHFIKSLKSNGKGAIILPLGVLFRGNAEAGIRKSIIDRGYIKGIIGLPANLFYGTGIAASIIIIDKEDAEYRKGIFMIDAGKGFIKDGNKNRLREQDIHQIVDVFNKQLPIPKYSRLVPLSEIKGAKNDYNLNIPRYIDSQEKEDIQNIEAHLKGGIPKQDIDDLENYWKVYPTLKNNLFKSNQRLNFWDLNIANDEIKAAIFNHPEFISFSAEMDKVFVKWQTKNTIYLKALEEACLPKEVIKEISEDLLKNYQGKELINKYDIYQHLMDYWAETMQDDLYELTADGWKAGNVVTRILKKTKKAGKETSKEVAGIAGLEGQLIPPSLIIQEYFEAEQVAIDNLQSDLDITVSEKEELIEEHGGDEGALQNVSNKKEAEQAQRDFTIQAWQEYLPDSFKAFDIINQKYNKGEAQLLKGLENPYIENVKSSKGKITQKTIKERLEKELIADEKKVLEDYLQIIKDLAANKIKVNAAIKETFNKVKKLIKEKPDEDYLFELSLVIKFIELLEKETNLKTDIKKGLADLEVKIIKQYPKLSIDEIKTIVVDKKWMATMEIKIKTEMDAISHRLTERIKELAVRYETPMPKLTNDVADLTSKVENHLKKMGYAW